MKLWVFSNQGYGFGEDILAEAVRVAKALGMESHIVISTRNAGRKYKFYPSARGRLMRLLARFAFKLEIVLNMKRFPLFVDDVNSADFYRKVEAGDIGLIAGFDQIFRIALIQRFGELVNFHPSLLPLYRGANPSDWCLANREKMTGYTIHHVIEQIDAGEILYQQVVAIDEGDTAFSLDKKISAASLVRVQAVIQHLAGISPMKRSVLDPYRIYETHLDYVKPGTSRSNDT